MIILLQILTIICHASKRISKKDFRISNYFNYISIQIINAALFGLKALTGAVSS
ncbi:MAG: hypothetical protein ACKO7P_05435 [Bacteroidota bacterium]